MKKYEKIIGDTEGFKRPPVYIAYHNIRARCLNKSNPNYESYGGRGIRICERWLGDDGFHNFYTDMGERPTPKHTIDRIDNNGNYEPDNCRWATRREQIRNRRLRSDNTSGVEGVYYRPVESKNRKKRWTVRVMVKGRFVHIGDFLTKEEAVKVRGELSLNLL